MNGRDMMNPTQLPWARFAFLGLLLAGLGACGGSGSGASAVAPSAGSSTTPASLPSTPTSAPGWGGHFIGAVTIGGVDYYGDALLTSDGTIRLYVGGPYADDGTVQQSRPESSEQFVGKLQVNVDQASGSGVIIGQQCAPPHEHTGFCGESASGEIHISQYVIGPGDFGIKGEIQVTANNATATWPLDLASLGIWVGPVGLEEVQGKYQEELAEFALDGDTIVSIDLAGQLFFQSAHSGCIGNGTLAPHLDGKFAIFDVTLTIASCNAPYNYLNGEFEGLATTNASSIWDYDSLLWIFLSRQDGAQPPAAVTMLGLPM